jgi:hypothetical protein
LALVGIALLCYIAVPLIRHLNKPKASVEDYDNTPENYRNSLGLKVIDPGDLSPEKYKKVYRFVWVVEDAIGFESEAYLASFPKDAVKKFETKNDSRVVIFSDFRPSFYDYRRSVNLNGSIYMDLLKRAAKECSLRAKWLRE